MARKHKTRSSEEIEQEIQRLLALKKKVIERENITKFSNISLERLRKILANHCCEFSEEEINHIFEPVMNFERNVFKKKQAEEKKKEAENV